VECAWNCAALIDVVSVGGSDLLELIGHRTPLLRELPELGGDIGAFVGQFLGSFVEADLPVLESVDQLGGNLLVL
jgi:hypothetical protein